MGPSEAAPPARLVEHPTARAGGARSFPPVQRQHPAAARRARPGRRLAASRPRCVPAAALPPHRTTARRALRAMAGYGQDAYYDQEAYDDYDDAYAADEAAFAQHAAVGYPEASGAYGFHEDAQRYGDPYGDPTPMQPAQQQQSFAEAMFGGSRRDAPTAGDEGAMSRCADFGAVRELLTLQNRSARQRARWPPGAQFWGIGSILVHLRGARVDEARKPERYIRAAVVRASWERKCPKKERERALSRRRRPQRAEGGVGTGGWLRVGIMPWRGGAGEGFVVGCGRLAGGCSRDACAENCACWSAAARAPCDALRIPAVSRSLKA